MGYGEIRVKREDTGIYVHYLLNSSISQVNY